MINGWKYYQSRTTAYAADPARRGRQADYWTNSPTRAWVGPDGNAYVLTYLIETDELMLFRQSGRDDTWISQRWDSQEAADTALAGYGSAAGNWTWLLERVDA